jgi:hypothetical protein
MSFWNLSDNTTAKAETTFDMGGGSVIPDNTNCKAVIDEAKWDEYQGVRNINLRWEVVDGEFKGRKVFQKVRVHDSDSKKADKARRMLAAIDANCGGNLMKKTAEPTDADLMGNLMYKPMVIKVMVWEIDGKQGNWISSVSSASAAAIMPASKIDESDIQF